MTTKHILELEVCCIYMKLYQNRDSIEAEHIFTQQVSWAVESKIRDICLCVCLCVCASACIPWGMSKSKFSQNWQLYKTSALWPLNIYLSWKFVVYTWSFIKTEIASKLNIFLFNWSKICDICVCVCCTSVPSPAFLGGCSSNPIFSVRFFFFNMDLPKWQVVFGNW